MPTVQVSIISTEQELHKIWTYFTLLHSDPNLHTNIFISLGLSKRKTTINNHSHLNFQDRWNLLYWSHRFYLPNGPYLKADRCKEFQGYPSTSDFRISIEHSNLLNTKSIKWINKMEISNQLGVNVTVSVLLHLVSYLIQEHKSTASLWGIPWHLSQCLTHQTSL
jgi:hypothetical protein